MMEIKQGSVVAFKTHPYLDKNTNIKIAAYTDYTSPLLIVKELKEKSYSKDTGKDIPQQLHCLYYNSRDGKFIEKWISANLVNNISFSIVDHKILFDFELKKDLDELHLKNDIKGYEKLIEDTYIDKKVVLKTVDLELLKIKVNRTKENGDLLETNHLEFLPPIMTIVNYRFLDDRSKFCEKTGIPLIELKCKWFNSHSKTFSESYFPYKILYQIREIQNLYPEKDLLSEISESIEENTLYNFPIFKPFILEGYDKIEINKVIGLPIALIFKHYFYQVNYFDFISQNKSTITIDQDFRKISEINVFGKSYPNYDSGYKSNTSDCKFLRGKYYFITYQDTYNNITKRIIKVEELFIFIKNITEFEEKYDLSFSSENEDDSKFVNYHYHEDGKLFLHLEGEEIHNNTIEKEVYKDTNVEIFLHANCLLRKGKYRNFKINKMLEIKEILDGDALFENTLET